MDHNFDYDGRPQFSTVEVNRFVFLVQNSNTPIQRAPLIGQFPLFVLTRLFLVVLARQRALDVAADALTARLWPTQVNKLLSPHTAALPAEEVAVLLADGAPVVTAGSGSLFLGVFDQFLLVTRVRQQEDGVLDRGCAVLLAGCVLLSLGCTSSRLLALRSDQGGKFHGQLLRELSMLGVLFAGFEVLVCIECIRFHSPNHALQDSKPA